MDLPRSRVFGPSATSLLKKCLLGFFCSTQCSGEVILQIYEVARTLRDARVPVIGGFHTPMEKECLDLLLRGSQPIVICPPRSIKHMRLPTPWKAPLMEGRLLILSPFVDKHRRPIAALARKRNTFVAALASKIFVAYAAPGSKTERFCSELLSNGKSLLTLESCENTNLIAQGAVPFRPETDHNILVSLK